MKKKVCMLVAEHPFMDSRIFKKEAKSLKKNGYDVTMIVPKKNGYLFDVDGTPFTKKFMDSSFVHEGITVVTYDSEDSKGPLSNVRKNFTSWEESIFNNPLTQLAIIQDADIYHAHEYLSLFAGIGVKRIMKKRKNKNVKLIYDSHELTPDPLENRYTENVKKDLKEKLIHMIKEIDYIITVSHSIKSWYLSKDPSLPIEVIYNSPPLTQGYRQKNYNGNGLILCYEGNIDQKKGNKDKIFKITDICSRNMDFQFKVIGGPRFGDSFALPEKLQNNIKLTGWVDYSLISKEMEQVDIGWIDFDGLEHSLNRSYAMPNKFFSYLNNGVPILVNKSHEMETFIRSHQCGLVVNKTHAEAEDFASALVYLYKNKSILKQMSKNARKVMEDLYSWEHMEKRLFDVYEKLTDNTLRYIK